MMNGRIVDDEITLVRYYPNYKTALAWYQDLDLCKQVNNRDTVYDLGVLKGMYKHLNQHAVTKDVPKHLIHQDRR